MNIKKIGNIIYHALYVEKHLSSKISFHDLEHAEQITARSTLRLVWLLRLIAQKHLPKIMKKSFLRPHLCTLFVLMELKLYSSKAPYTLSSLWKNYLSKHKVSWLFKPTWAFLNDLNLPLENYRDSIACLEAYQLSLLSEIFEEHPHLTLDQIFSHPTLWVVFNKPVDQKDESLFHLKEPSPSALQAFKVHQTCPIEFFHQGIISYQDSATHICFDLFEKVKKQLSPRPAVIRDLCASPGGKTLLLHQTWPEARIIASDCHEHKIKSLKGNIQRVLGADHRIECVLHDWTQRLEVKEKADLILIDMPCSGTGVIRKHPDLLWSKDRLSIKSLVQTQQTILLNALEHLSYHGVIVLSTCSVLSRENDRHVEFCLKQDSALKEFLFALPLGKKSHSHGWQLLPNGDHDGTYMAVLTRQ